MSNLSKLESDLRETADNLRANSKLPSGDDFILAIVGFLDGDSHHVNYLRQPFHREPEFRLTSVYYNFGELFSRAEKPACTS